MRSTSHFIINRMRQTIASLIVLTTFLNIGFSQKNNIQSIANALIFNNPVWDGADPWMVKQGDNYVYCYSVNNSIRVSKSKRMTISGETKTIWTAPPTGWNQSCIWALETHFLGNRWYVYYAAGESGPPFIHQRSGVLRSKTSDVFSNYEDLGILNTGDNQEDSNSAIWAVDLTVFEFKNKLYAVWSGWIKNENTDATQQYLYLAEMENPCKIKGKRIQISSPNESWETGGPLNLNEGPEMLQNGNQLFIVYSCRESWLTDYKLGMLKLIDPNTSLLDPTNWSKIGPVFSGNEQVYGVGHCSFVKSPDGKEDWIIYHSKKSTAPGWDRDVRIQPFTWNRDGTPNFGSPVPAGQKLSVPSGEI